MREIKKVNINEIESSPIHSFNLPSKYYREALSIYQMIVEVEGGSFEKFEENFRRDSDFEKEITIWRCIATAYQNFVTARMTITLAEKKDAFYIALSSSMRFESEDKVVASDNISLDDAKFIYRTYRNMIEQTFKNRRSHQ